MDGTFIRGIVLHIVVFISLHGLSLKWQILKLPESHYQNWSISISWDFWIITLGNLMNWEMQAHFLKFLLKDVQHYIKYLIRTKK
jgi:hypothetical protein